MARAHATAAQAQLRPSCPLARAAPMIRVALASTCPGPAATEARVTRRRRRRRAESESVQLVTHGGGRAPLPYRALPLTMPVAEVNLKSH
jgi:hypothetical protein